MASTITISKKEVELTASAAAEIIRQRDKRGTPDARIRVGVRGGGCTGFTYVFEWADAIRKTDKEFAKDGAAIVVDPKSLVYLGGMQLDFVKNMMGHGFKFNNPNAKGECGCGESVQF
ncbi:MAG: iron-sulfur cluster assembly accessory protein [Proteobacteria bacterium]|nr:iron-sulfur cluster assembly accessory protein [Pseudomonadota bacterium]